MLTGREIDRNSLHVEINFAGDFGSTAGMTIADAAKFWLSHRIARKEISPGSIRQYRFHLKPLSEFFQSKPLGQIAAEDVFQYQRTRQQTAGASLINHECSMLRQLLESADLWDGVGKHYRPIRLPDTSPGRALSPEAERVLLAIAESNPHWKVAFLCTVLSVNTTMGPGEIRHLQLRDVNLDHSPYSVYLREGVKNEYRHRWIPLNRPAELAMRELVKRAHEHGAYLPEHYLLPHKGTKDCPGSDPTRPMYGWKKAWSHLREAASKRCPEIARLRRYDLRHHAITKLLENSEISFDTVQSIAGHVSKATTERYSHIRQRIKLDAVRHLESAPEVARWRGMERVG